MNRMLPLAAVVFAAGCATSTIETRREEHLDAYHALSPEWRELVDQGQITIGMPHDAVYIAWGAPDQVLHSETAEGLRTIWLYHGRWLEETRYWSYREVRTRRGHFLERYLERDYLPRRYVQAEIHLSDGAVKEWRTLPQPMY